MLVSTLPLSEAFGPTLQGEGPHQGRAASFVRLGGCNLSCSWCDTPYTWDGGRYDLRQELIHITPAEIVLRLPPVERAPLVVLSGGEPLLHQDSDAWGHLLVQLADAGYAVQVETNGTLYPNATTAAHVAGYSVSPKQAHAGSHRGRQDPAIHPGWRHPPVNAHLKIVVRTYNDVADAVATADALAWPHRRVWVMPEGTDTPTLTERWPTIATAAAEHGINATHRLHVLAWGDKRGT